MDDDSPTPLHRRAWDLIPWVVAGSASAAEHRLVEQHAAGCIDCQEELAFQHQLHAGMLAPVDDLPAAEPALQRLLARIDSAAGDQPVAETGPLRRSTPSNAARWLSAAVVVQAIALAALLGMLLERPRVADYITLSQTPAKAAAAQIRLVPDGQLRLAELQSLLASAGLQVVEINADASLLGVALASGSSADIGAALVRLRATPGVLLAEPVRP